jgi:acyl dehydratase
LDRKHHAVLTFTNDHVKKYAELTGDYNPVHFEEDFARRTKFGKLIVQGGLTTGLIDALVAMDMPGPGTVFLGQNWKFIAPVFIGDTINRRGRSAECSQVKAGYPGSHYSQEAG